MSPREESVLSRRLSLRSPGGCGQDPPTRHLPGQSKPGSLHRRGPAGYRRPSASGSGSCSSLPASPAARRRQQPAATLKRRPTPRPGAVTRLDTEAKPPPGLVSRGQYRRLGDLTPEEQRSVLALIRGQEEAVVTVASGEHQVIITRAAASLTSDPLSSAAGERRRARAGRGKARASSLPDVLEEDSISVKSLTAET